MQNYPATRQGDQNDWLDPLVWSHPKVVFNKKIYICSAFLNKTDACKVFNIYCMVV